MKTDQQHELRAAVWKQGATWYAAFDNDPSPIEAPDVYQLTSKLRHAADKIDREAQVTIYPREESI